MEPLILELERETAPVLLVSHADTLDMLYGYFVGCAPQSIHSLKFPRDTVVKYTSIQVIRVAVRLYIYLCESL